MIRRTLALSLAAVSLFSLSACSGKSGEEQFIDKLLAAGYSNASKQTVNADKNRKGKYEDYEFKLKLKCPNNLQYELKLEHETDTLGSLRGKGFYIDEVTQVAPTRVKTVDVSDDRWTGAYGDQFVNPPFATLVNRLNGASDAPGTKRKYRFAC